MTDNLDHLADWVGKTETAEDLITANQLAGMSATLDRDDPAPVPGTPLPPGWHWMFFLTRKPMSELGPDGHAKRGGFLPPVPLPRRMWAGGRLNFLKPLTVGETITKLSTIKDVKVKEGKTGRLVFVLVEHQVSGADGLALVEEHDIVYREAAGPNDKKPDPKPAPGQAVWQRTITPDPVMLFRYSALTFNGHRIHYDYKYVTEVEGYPGLIFHGPLTATLLMDLCRREKGDGALKAFSFRAVSPLFDTAPFVIQGEPSADGKSARVWALNPAGELAMTAEAEFI